MRLASLLPALLLLGAAPSPTALTITLSSYRFDPASIRLQHGQTYRLHLVNPSGSGHNFVAPAFFAAAGTNRRAIEVPGGASADVDIVAPAPGRYPVKCSHFLHSTFGMKGEIIVE
jgi:uncharacterized cupredoxin-like copper-binding protein